MRNALTQEERVCVRGEAGSSDMGSIRARSGPGAMPVTRHCGGVGSPCFERR